MLKIKSNVDLKELEKFGFVKNGDNYIFESGIYNFIEEEENKIGGFSIYVNKYKVIFIKTEDSIEGGWVSNFNKLFDLIEADYVEKI